MRQLEPCKVLEPELSNRSLTQQERQNSRSRLRYLLMKDDLSSDQANQVRRRKKVQRRMVMLEQHKALELEQP